MEIKSSGKKESIILVSPEDYEELSKFKWFINNGGYAHGNCDGKMYKMHRFIMKPSDNYVVDHINGNKLDNRKINLRITSTQKNNENKRKIQSKLPSSDYLGVCKIKNNNKYHAVCKYDGKTYNLGNYNDEKTAAEMRDTYIVQNKLDHMTLNFPDKKEKYLKSDVIKPSKKQENKCGYYGITYNKKNNKYTTKIKINKKTIHIATSNTMIEAAKAYDKYIVDNNIPRKELNFVEDHPNYNPNCVIKTNCIEINDKSVDIGNDVIIDKENYDKIKYHTVCTGSRYPKILINNKTIILSRYILNVYKGSSKIFVDHIDGNPKNNSAVNLRLSDCKKNAQNKLKTKNKLSSSNFVGIDKHKGIYHCGITKNGKTLFNAYNKDENVVTRLRDMYIIKYLKDDHYKLNLEWTEHDKKKWEYTLDDYLAENHTKNIKSFDEHYNDLKEWVEKYNKIPSKKPVTDVLERKLGDWCQRKRNQHKNGTIADNEKNLLEQISFWYWNKNDDNSCHNIFFNARLNELKNWVGEHNKLPRIKTTDLIEKKLGGWCSGQRKQKQINKLSESEIDKLEQVPHWYWSRF